MMGGEAQVRIVCPLETPELCEKILVFCERYANMPLYVYQRAFAYRVIESLLLNDADTITGLWSRQSGKTSTIGVLCAGLMVILPTLANAFPHDVRLGPFYRGFYCSIFAPIKFQADLAFAKVRETTHCESAEALRADPEIDVEVSSSRADTVALTNGSFVRSVSASPDTQIEGQTLHLAVLEEAQKLTREKVEKDITPMLSSTNGSLVKIGTAWETRGGFHTSIQHNLHRLDVDGVRNHFQFDCWLVIKEKRVAYDQTGQQYHLNYEKFISKELSKPGGADSLEFKMNYLCLWNETRSIAVDLTVLTRASDPTREAYPHRQGVQVAGLDLGKTNDRTVLTLMEVDYTHPVYNYARGPEADEEKQVYYRKYILDWLELDGVFEGVGGQYEALVEYLTRLSSVKVLVVDSTGFGDAIYERLSAMLGDSIHVEPFVFTTPNKGGGYKYYLQELKSGRVVIPAGPETRNTQQFRRFIHEHEQLERYTVGVHTLVAAPAGDENHDDYPDSAMLAAHGERILDRVLMPDIQVSNPSMPRGSAGAPVDFSIHKRQGRPGKRWKQQQ